MMSYTVTPETTQDKQRLLQYFRERGEEKLADLRQELGNARYKQLAGGVNTSMGESLEAFKQVILRTSDADKWADSERLCSLLTATYCAQVAMLDLRNQVWPYEYMAFSRRIGELWERFVHLPFTYPITNMSPFIPPLFSEVRTSLRQEIDAYLLELPLATKQKKDLLGYYEKIWILVDSGEISLQLDLHAIINGAKVNIDLKSGFGSNEKGNVNRLLMVATIYKNIDANYQNILLVRAREDLNNHYFQTLKNSHVWQAYCGEEAYSKIGEYTGFALREWIITNVDWASDLLPETVSHFTNNNLLGYLEW
jgi:hypothetical protein